MHEVRATWPRAAVDLELVLMPRDDVLREARVATGTFDQAHGPFTVYRRTVSATDDEVTQTVAYELRIPWFGWLFAVPARRYLRQPPGRPGSSPWWAPPQQLDARAVAVLGLLAGASLIVGYCNTLFTQTVAFASDEFGTSAGAQGIAGAVVRAGIVIAVVVMALSDRVGRRQVLTGTAIAAPLICSLGAFAPSFALLTLSQMIGRPLAIALGLVVGIVAAEEMPAGGRAYAISLAGMATGLGAGLCVLALPLADLGERGWRLVYLLTLALLVIAIPLRHSLPESRRFALPHAEHATLPGRRLALLAVSGFFFNLLVAPSSFFQNRYLKDVRGFSASLITVFTISTGTPAGLGIVAGGRLADVHGRRIVGFVALLGLTVGVVGSYTFGGPLLWLFALGGSIVGAMSVPALGVYLPELFPTNRRGRASGIVSAVALVGSSIGLIGAGALIDAGWSYGATMALLAIGPLIEAGLVITVYPETAKVELDVINPADQVSGVTDEPARPPPS